MKFARKRTWSALALAVAVCPLSCSHPPDPCQFEVAFDSTQEGNTEVYTLALDSLAVRQITNVSEPAIANRFPDWSPDGRKLVFVSENSAGIGELFIVTEDGTGLRKLTSDPAQYENPAWSPEGEWIAFEKGTGESWGLYLIRPDGGDLQQVEGHNLFHPSWSPDGRHIAVVTGDESEYYGAVVDLDNGLLERFTPDGLNVGSVNWSPDGADIAFDAVVGDNFDLYIADSDGENLRRLTKSPAIDARPEWSPDGSRLLFHSTRDFGPVPTNNQRHHFELYLLDLETGEVERLTRNQFFDAHPDWCTAAG